MAKPIIYAPGELTYAQRQLAQFTDAERSGARKITPRKFKVKATPRNMGAAMTLQSSATRPETRAEQVAYRNGSGSNIFPVDTAWILGKR